MTDQEKKELREAINRYEVFNGTNVLPKELDVIINAAKKLLEASESLPSNHKINDLLIDDRNSQSNRECCKVGFNKAVDQCTATVAAHYVPKKYLPDIVFLDRRK